MDQLYEMQMSWPKYILLEKKTSLLVEVPIREISESRVLLCQMVSRFVVDTDQSHRTKHKPLASNG